MSEFFTGVTFPQQKVTPSDDAAIRRAVLADSILSGCALSYAGSTLTMGAGMLLGCGRQFRHTSVQNWAVTGATSGYARLVLTLDMSKASTKDAFEQVIDSIEYASSLNGFLQLQQDDINESGTIYQMEICVVSLGAGGITGIVSSLGFNPRLPTAEEIGAEPAIESDDHPGCFYRMVDGVQEWLNPPMVEGVEYRTTERYRGLVVYTQLFNLGILTDEKAIKTNLSAFPIRIAGLGNTSGGQVYPTPWANNNNLSDGYSMHYMVSHSAPANGGVLTIYIRCGSSLSGSATGLCQVWYVYGL